MANTASSDIFNYIKQHGDLPMTQAPFTEADNVVFCLFSYIPLDRIVCESFRETITIAEAYKIFDETDDPQILLNKECITHREDFTLFRLMAESRRFGPLKLCGYVNRVDFEEQKQFSVVTIDLDDGSVFLAFRGTDDTFAGWKEDFNMCYLTPVPSQKEAVDYLIAAADHFTCELRLGGHSKGGNLSVYASTFCGEKIQQRIIDVYNNDGPGFESDVLTKNSYRMIRDRIHTAIPQSSVVGMLFDHEEDYSIIKSRQIGFFQHDLYSWEISHTSLSRLENVTKGSLFINHTLKDWVANMDHEHREQFTEVLYSILKSTNTTTWTEFGAHWPKHTGILMSYLKNCDSATRQLIFKTLGALFYAARANLFSGKQKGDYAS